MAQYNQVTPEIVERLQAIAPGRVYTGADVNEDYSRDEMPIYGTRMPDVAIDAMSTEEISAIMKICNENHIPVTCRGAGTGLAGACTPIAGGVVICTMKMKKILSYDTDNFTVTVQPGVLLNDLAEDALKQGLLYPPDPGEKFATLGGNVSTNAGGMRAVKYGATRDYVRSMTVVLPSGEVVKFGSSVSKTSSGYSLLNLMIGSEGTLGIITELTLKLIPAPKVTVSLIVPYESLPDAIATVPQFKKAHMNPQALEFFEREILISSEEYLGKAVFPRNVGGTDVGAYLLVTFDGETQEEIDAIVEKAAELVLDKGYDVLLLTEDVDEFCLQIMRSYPRKDAEGKDGTVEFKNVNSGDLGLETEDEKKAAEDATAENKPLFDAMKDALDGKVKEVKVSTRLKDHPVCLSADGPLSIEMEKVLSKQPGSEGVKSDKVLELNINHPVFAVLKAAQEAGDTDKVKKYSSLLYAQAQLIEGLPVDDPAAYAEAVCSLMK